MVLSDDIKLTWNPDLKVRLQQRETELNIQEELGFPNRTLAYILLGEIMELKDIISVQEQLSNDIMKLLKRE